MTEEAKVTFVNTRLIRHAYGEGVFTDLSISYRGDDYGSRHHGGLNDTDIATQVAGVRRRADARRAERVEPVEPHYYHPSVMHMGDCSVCGHLQESPLHITHDPERTKLL